MPVEVHLSHVGEARQAIHVYEGVVKAEIQVVFYGSKIRQAIQVYEGVVGGQVQVVPHGSKVRQAVDIRQAGVIFDAQIASNYYTVLEVRYLGRGIGCDLVIPVAGDTVTTVAILVGYRRLGFQGLQCRCSSRCRCSHRLSANHRSRHLQKLS